MPPDISALPSVEFDFTDAEVKAVYAILSSLQPGHRSLVSSVIVPLLLMGGLMAWAAPHDLSSNTFGMLLIPTIISYLACHFALRYEILRNARIRGVGRGSNNRYAGRRCLERLATSNPDARALDQRYGGKQRQLRDAIPITAGFRDYLTAAPSLHAWAWSR